MASKGVELIVNITSTGRRRAVQSRSGIHFAVKVNRYGETEPAYLPHLKKTIYQHKGDFLGYGIKVWPEDYETIKTKAPEVKNIGGL
jgi:hypothetical protein